MNNKILAFITALTLGVTYNPIPVKNTFAVDEISYSLGDIDNSGTVDASDASFILAEYSALSTTGISTLTDAQKVVADIDKDGLIDATDASTVLTYYAYASTGGEVSFETFVILSPETATTTTTTNTETTTTTVTTTKTVITPQEISLSEKSINITVGETYKPYASVVPENADDTSLIWSSSDSNIVSVNDEGLLTANNIGNATIIIKSNANPDIYAEISVTVTPVVILPQSIEIWDSSVSLNVGETFIPYAVALPENATDRSLTWSSSDNNVATVDNDGKITAKNTGNAIITIKSNANPDVYAEIPVTVIILPQSIEIWDSSVSLNVGETFIPYAAALPENATDRSLTWSSSDNNVATVDNDGKITAKNTGNAVITIRSNANPNVYAEIPVTVIILPQSIEIWDLSVSLTVGETFIPHAATLPENATDTSLTWSSSNNNVATVNNSGEIIAKSAGNAVITIRSNANPDVYAEIPVTVNEESRVIYITKTGKKYHYDNNCNGGTYFKASLEYALSLGLTPCEKCVH